MLSHGEAEKLVNGLVKGIGEDDFVARWEKGGAYKQVRRLKACDDFVIAWVPKTDAESLKWEANDIKRIRDEGIRTPQIE